MGLSQRITQLLEAWLGEGECLPQIRPFVESLPTPSSGLSDTDTLVNVTTTATEIVAENSKRRKIQLQNQGILPILCKSYSAVGVEDFNFILAASSGINTGDGAPWDSETIKGSIWGITVTDSSIVTVMEEVI